MELRKFHCCICKKEILRLSDSNIIYPEEMLCEAHSQYVNAIMDAFRDRGVIWKQEKKWVDFIAANKWILEENEEVVC